MAHSTRSAVWCLGAVQCATWGVLYYGFAVWQLPLQARLGLPMAQVAAAFSLALLVAAVLAPRVGRAFDHGHGPALFRLGVVAAVAGLVALACARSAPMLFTAWLGIGIGMALTLYESAFALVQRAVTEPGERMRALAAVTVAGGLASTLFLPLMGGLVQWRGLQVSLLGSALIVLLAALLMERRVLPALHAVAAVAPAAPTREAAPGGPIVALAIVFTSGTVAGMSLITLLVPLLVSRGTSLANAAMVLGALGMAQLPGRLWLLRGGRMPSAGTLTVAPMLMQAGGLLLVATPATASVAATGVAMFGLGAGLHTLARPWLVQQRFGAQAGHRNGQVAMAQGLGRAATPVAAAVAATAVGPGWTLAALAACLLLLAPLAWRVASPGAPPLRARIMRRTQPALPDAAARPSRR